ncbi:MAG: aldehyde dehydrogenase family protein, partial [Candidatus Kapabacteria bacterium]|nr:aldehyde dehydrogenase family protein [Candidatus Kapabacteria bacterium]
HDGVNLIGFTGSTTTGKAIAAKCGASNKKCSLEMGGKNAVAVMPDANLDLVLDGILWGAFGTTGQRCTATSRAILHKDIHDTVVEKLVKRASKLRIGPGLSDSTEMGPVINARQKAKVMEYIGIATAEGATLALGGSEITDGDYAHGNFVQPTIFTGVTNTMRLFKEEVFGPVLAVTKADSFSHALDLINDCDYGLSSSLYTGNINEAFTAMRDIEAGITYINAPTIGAEAHMPFGGIKGTGNGHREGGWTVFDIFTEWKSVYVDFSGSLQRAQIDNYED